MFVIDLLLKPFALLLGEIQYRLFYRNRNESLSDIVSDISKIMGDSYDKNPQAPMDARRQAEHELWRRRVLEGRTRDDA